MARSDSPSVAATVKRLESHLARARAWKPSLSIDPPLPVLEFSGEKGLPITDSKTSTSLHNTLIETASRHIFHRVAASTDIQDPEFTDVWNLFDIINICGDQGQCETTLAWSLIEELLDIQSIEGCRVAFDYLDSRRERLTTRHFKAKQLIILRACNELLRRLSRAEDTVFCGRVYIFLFQSFPLGDKSSVNLRGEFHTENVTTFEQGPPPAAAEIDAGVGDPKDVSMEDANKPPSSDSVTITVSDGDEKADQKAKEKKKHLTADELYPIFWTLQKSFSNPPRLFNTEHLDEFKSGLDETLATFKRGPKVIPAPASDEKRGVKRKAGEMTDEFANTYNPKYLTSRELFTLELSDLAFRRDILVQALILLDFLLSLSEKSKEKLVDLNVQKALQYQFTLTEQNADWATNMRSTIAGYLQDGTEGKLYYRMVDTVLSRDRNWVRWKMENCPPIAKPPVAADDFVAAKAEARKACTVTRRPMQKDTFNLAFLTDNEDLTSLQGLKQPERFDLPSSESLWNGVQNDELDLDMAMNDEEKSTLEESIQTKTWRLLRRMAREKLGLFNATEDGKNLKAFFKQPEVEQSFDKPGDSQEIAPVPDTAEDGTAQKQLESALELTGTALAQASQ